MLKAAVSTCLLAVLAYGLGAPVAASEVDRATRFTFNQPITLPGVTLPAGTYTFRLADPTTGRRVVQVLNDKSTQSYAMLMSLSAYRPDIPREAEISFLETGRGMPAAVKTWWQEGSTLGYEFQYPKDQLQKLTGGKRSLSSGAEARSSGAAGSAIVYRPPVPTDAAKPDVTPMGDDNSAASVSQNQYAQSPAPAAQQTAPATDQETRTELPRTASSIPLAGLLGMLTLASGAWLTRRTKA